MKLVTDNVKAFEPKDKEFRKEIMDQMMQKLQEVTEEGTVILSVHRDGEIYSYSTVDPCATHAFYTIMANVMLDDVISDL